MEQYSHVLPGKESWQKNQVEQINRYRPENC